MGYAFTLLLFSITIVLLIVGLGILYERRQEKMDEKLYTLYKKDKDFHDYVDAYCHKHGIYLYEALEHKMVRTVAKERMN